MTRQRPPAACGGSPPYQVLSRGRRLLSPLQRGTAAKRQGSLATTVSYRSKSWFVSAAQSSGTMTMQAPIDDLITLWGSRVHLLDRDSRKLHDRFCTGVVRTSLAYSFAPPSDKFRMALGRYLAGERINA